MPIRRLARYLAIAFAFSWIMWVLGMLGARNIIHISETAEFVIIVCGSFGPFALSE